MAKSPPYSSLSLVDDQTSFRLFALHGSLSHDGPISGTLYNARLDDNTAYEALSYCWGDSKRTEAVLINGHDGLTITANLASALRALRLQHKCRLLWIDAICIDQSNVGEKNFQVQLMRRIFATCFKTVVWLGPSDDKSRRASQVIQKSPRDYTNVINGVLSRPWFRRVWVIQEIAFAPEVELRCGEDRIDWDSLALMCSKVNRGHLVIDVDAAAGSRHFHPSFYPRILNATRRRIRKGERLPILEALRSFRSFDATIGSDKVYGILGLLDRPNFVTVDYKKPLQAVFQEVALAAISASQSLEILSACLPQEAATSSGWNSWVPDWTDARVDIEQDVQSFSREEVFFASRNTIVEAKVCEGGNLQVSAHFIATVAEIAHPWKSIQDLRDLIWPEGQRLPRKRAYELPCYLLDLYQHWQDVACRINGRDGTLQDRYITNESIMEAWYNTFFNTAPPFADFNDAQRFDQWIYGIELGLSAFRWWQRHIAKQLPWFLVYIISGPYVASISVALLFLVVFRRVRLETPPPAPTAFRSTWSFGRTSNGLLGLFPAPNLAAPKAISTRPEDAVAIIKGGAHPYVLRKQADGWQLIGDAYIHGIMHGAAFSESKCEPITLL